MSPQQSSESEQPPESKYPEHEKLAAVKDKSQAIGEFLDWLGDNEGLRLCVYRSDWGSWQPTHTPTLQLLAKFFEIDLDRLEAEKRLMLDEIRSAQHG